MEQKIIEVIDTLAEKLGVATEFLWPILIRQAYVEGIMALFWAIVFFFIIIVCFTGFKEGIRLDEKGYDESPAALMTISALVGLGAFVALAMYIKEGISILLNPEYWAIQQILKHI